MPAKTTLGELLRLMPEGDPKTYSRRKVLSTTAGAAALGLFGGSMLHDASAAGTGTARNGFRLSQDATPMPLPADAAPAERQIFYQAADGSVAKAMDFYEAVYERAAQISDLFSEPLIRINRNFELIPAGAESWSGSEDGMTWTFKIRQGNVWSDGNPVTAADWVKTFQYGADPAHAWDFTWFFQGVLKGWNDAIAGKIKPEELGVTVGANEYELVLQTEVPAPYIPAMMLYSLFPRQHWNHLARCITARSRRQ